MSEVKLIQLLMDLQNSQGLVVTVRRSSFDDETDLQDTRSSQKYSRVRNDHWSWLYSMEGGDPEITSIKFPLDYHLPMVRSSCRAVV